MANINVISKTLASFLSPEDLGTNLQRFKSVIFFGGKGTAESNNSGTVFIQLRQMSADGTSGDWLSAMPVPAGGWSAGLNRSTLADGVYDASQIRIKVGTNGDGIVAIVGS